MPPTAAAAATTTPASTGKTLEELGHHHSTSLKDRPDQPLFFWVKCTQLATTDRSNSVVIYRGDAVFKWADPAVLAHMDQGLLRIPDTFDETGAPAKTPWALVQLRQLVLLEYEGKFECMWRRVKSKSSGGPSGEVDHPVDDMYGARKLRLPALKAILGGLDIDSDEDAMKERVKYIFEGIPRGSEAWKSWEAFIAYAKSKSFQSELSINLSELMDLTPSPFAKRLEVDPDFERYKKPRQEFDSAIVPIARPKRPKEAEETDETLVPAPPHLFPINNGGSLQMTSVYGLPSSSTVFHENGQVLITAPSSLLKRAREADDVPDEEKISKKQLRSLYDRVSVQAMPGGRTVFSFSAHKVERDTSVGDNSYLVFHGSSPTRFIGHNPLSESPEFAIEDVHGASSA